MITIANSQTLEILEIIFQAVHKAILLMLLSPGTFEDRNLKHYGAFFNNPRVLQDSNKGNERQPRCESVKKAKIQMCRDPCYTLNVTTFDIKTEQFLLFGMSHGCSTLILLPSKIQSSGCYHSNILLKTIPAHPLQTQYCFCTNDSCNIIRPANALMRVGASRFKEQEVELVTHNYTIPNITSGSTAKSVHLSGTFLLLFVLIR
uniref:Uncharacterized protein n=1 Tax=Wuchereria bancrofti TaxID=6293 RepID=A0A1I8ESG8_WUCBA